MASLDGLFGSGSTARQMFIWGVLQPVISTLLAPELNELQQLSFEILANTPLTPSEVAAEIARGLIEPGAGEGEARKTGIDPDRLGRMVDLAKTVPSVTDAIDAYRRGLIPEGAGDPRTATLTGAMAASGLREEWRPIIEKLAIQLPSWQEAINADLTGQLDKATAQEWFRKAGGDPDAYQWLYDVAGQAPTPSQALELVNRGIIPLTGKGPSSTSYEQAFLEGPWRNKWLPSFEELRFYLPPPRTVTAMFKEGSLTKAEAVELLIKQGLTADLAAKYVQAGDSQAAQSSKDLTQSAVIDLYEARIIAKADAAQLLEALGYSTDNAAFLVQLADLRQSISQVNNAVTRVRSLFIGHKITAPVAQSVLRALSVPNDQVTEILTTWTLEAAVNVKVLTESQITGAFASKLITQAEAMGELEGIGYAPRDAWILLSIKNKGPLPGKPAQGPAPVPPL